MNIKKEEYKVLSMISHDLKSPLSGIIGCIEILESEISESGTETTKKMLHQMKLSSKHILELVNSILTMSKMAAGYEKPKFSEVTNLEEEMRQTINIFNFQAYIKNIEIKMQIEKNIPTVFWDIEKVRLHILSNILSNCLRFTPEGGNILLSVRKKMNHILIEIEDSGPGIPELELKTIFEAYKKIENQNKRKHGGQGLGLYNASIFTRMHNGNICAENVHSGDNEKKIIGAKFLIELPIKSEYQEIHF